MTKLTDKQEKGSEVLSNDRWEMFSHEFLNDLNGTQAAIRTGYSEKTAEVQASRMLSNVKVSDRIAFLKAVRVERVDIDADDIVRQLDEYRRSNIADYAELVTETTAVVSSEGVTTTPAVQVLKFKDFSKLTDEQKRCIESIKMGKHGVELKLHGTEWSVEKLNRHIGFYEADNNQGKKIIVTTQDRDDRIQELLDKANNG